QLAENRPGDLAIRFERDDLDRHVVETEREVVERLAIHVDHETVTDRRDGLAFGIHQHAGAVDGDVALWIAESFEDGVGIDGDVALDFDPLAHARILPPHLRRLRTGRGAMPPGARGCASARDVGNVNGTRTVCSMPR